MSDASFHYVVCSHDGIDPEEARQIAESKCFASAAKLGGVNVRLTQKTVQSLTGSDSSEVAEIQPLEAKIKCEWTDRFLETIKDGFRVWLQCKISKPATSSTLPESATSENKRPPKRAEAILILTTVPRADRLIIVGLSGERVIEPTANVTTISISNLDQYIEVKKLGYKSTTVALPKNLPHGGKVQRSAALARE